MFFEQQEAAFRPWCYLITQDTVDIACITVQYAYLPARLALQGYCKRAGDVAVGSEPGNGDSR